MSTGIITTVGAGQRPGRVIVDSSNGSVLLHDELNPHLENKREQAKQKLSVAICGSKTPTTEEAKKAVADLEEKLLAAARVPPGDPTPPQPSPPESNQFQEVDVSAVGRPELFHTPEVSGITLAIRQDVGGKLVPKWVTHLRRPDGKREVIERPERITLTTGGVLYLSPDPGEPPTAEAPAWSAQARRAWATTKQAPHPTDVFNAICERIAYYLDFPPETASGTAATIALWVILTYAFPAWDAVPYLRIGGPMGSGKSRVLEILQRLAFRAFSTSNLTAPALFRTLHAYGGTMLYDEAERLKQATPDVQELQSVFLSGYKRGGSATRLEPVGDSFRPVQFCVYGPKALASINDLSPTLSSRCICITMFRSADDSPKPKRRLDADPVAWQSVRDDLHALALEYGPIWGKLATRSTIVPDGISGRNYELWQPLLAIAEWLENHGATGLLSLVKAHATHAVVVARDDAVPEADEILLELLAEAIRSGSAVTSSDLLHSAKERDESTFKLWAPRTVTARLRVYGVATPKKVNGKRTYGGGKLEKSLREIGDRYAIDLGFADAKKV